jgi:hypothetical protein
MIPLDFVSFNDDALHVSLEYLVAFLFADLQVMMLCTRLMMMIYDCTSLKIAQ